MPDGVIELDFDRMTAARAAFHDRLLALFAEIANAKPKGMIIDLRQNGGGNAALGEDLLDFISDKPHRAFASIELRASPECRAYFTNRYGRDGGMSRDIAEKADGAMRRWDFPWPLQLRTNCDFRGPWPS